MLILFRVFLFIIGACIGSYLCCQVRRMHLKEQKKKPLGNRSVCLHCHYKLKWYDNLPIISWLMLKGKCRHCHKKIGFAELLSELGVALAFLLLSFSLDVTIATPLEWVIFVTTLFFTTILAFLAIYDGLYGELPSLCLALAIVCAAIILILKEYTIISATGFSPELIWKPILSFAILGGLYLMLYLISKGRWIGDGDWLLGAAIALALFEPWLSLVALFLANFIACLIMYPQIKHKKNHHIHFGPFLVIAFVISASFSNIFLGLVL